MNNLYKNVRFRGPGWFGRTAQPKAAVEDLTVALDQLKVPASEKNELLGLLAPLQDQIVGQ